MEEGQNNQEEVLGREEERNQENVDIAETGQKESYHQPKTLFLMLKMVFKIKMPQLTTTMLQLRTMSLSKTMI